MLFDGEDGVTLMTSHHGITLIPIATPSYECTGDITRNSCYIDHHEVFNNHVYCRSIIVPP